MLSPVLRTILLGKQPYQGPGDAIGSTGWQFWGSPARAFSLAYARNRGPMLDLQDQAGANPITINALPSGFIDIATIVAWVAAHTVTTINIATLYDQSGTGVNANSRHWRRCRRCY